MINQNAGDSLDAETFAAAMAAMSAIPIQEIANGCRQFARDLRAFHPIKLAAAFGGLLLQPALQSNRPRLEGLVHLSVALGNGTQLATSNVLLKGFSAVGRTYGSSEDPPEDIFVGNIASVRGNYLVLDGATEGGTYILQRLVNMVDGLPDEPRFQVVVENVHALLTLSDLVCRRASLHRHQMGSEVQESVLPKELALNRPGFPRHP